MTSSEFGTKSLFKACVYLCAFTYGTVALNVTSNQNFTNLTDVLNRLFQDYDARIRPNYGSGSPVVIDVHIFFSSLGPVSEIDMDFSMNMFFQQQWIDERLAFQGPIKRIAITHDILNSIWTPDTFFLNEKYGNFHGLTKPNILLRIENNGMVSFDTRLSVIASCDMDFHLYPFDKQVCYLRMESYSYGVEDVIFQWNDNPVSFDQHLSLSKYNLLRHTTSTYNLSYILSNYSTLELKLTLGREISHQVLNVYVPCILIVILSWVSLWIPRDATPARVTLGITTVLTMTTTMVNSGGDLPALSYLTAIDIFTTVCNIFVFSALLEFAFVSFYDKPVYKERRVKANSHQPSASEQRKQPSWTKSVAEDAEGFEPRSKALSVSENIHKRNLSKTDNHRIRHQSWPIGKEEIAAKLNQINEHVIMTGFKPSKVEFYARIIMPILYALFLVIYYIVYFVILNTPIE